MAFVIPLLAFLPEIALAVSTTVTAVLIGKKVVDHSKSNEEYLNQVIEVEYVVDVEEIGSNGKKTGKRVEEKKTFTGTRREWQELEKKLKPRK